MKADVFTSLADGLAESTRAYVAKSIGALVDRLTALEQRIVAVKDGDPGPAGLPGMTGAQGEPGPAGKDAVVTADQLREFVTADLLEPLVFKYLQTHPAPAGPEGAIGAKGLDGRDGRDGLPGVPGQSGEKGRDGRDGIDGRDGAGIDDMQIDHDGARIFSMKFVQGERVKAVGTFSVPVMMFQGTWRKTNTYEYQDVVSWGGSMWVCMYPNTTAQPGAETMEPHAWLKAVSKGSEGKAGPQGNAGEKGAKGEQGADARVYR